MKATQVRYKHRRQNKNRYIQIPLLAVLLLSAFIACDDAYLLDPSVSLYDLDFEAEDWTTTTHSNSAEPDYDQIFDDSKVQRIDIVITEDNWQAMLDDMTQLYGSFGSNRNSGPASDNNEDPMFVPAEIFYNDKQWYKVGIRFKGNSSLQNSWMSGILKLSLKLDFDEFEDDYPQIDNQRFYGFKKLSMKNNFDDTSFLREKVTAEFFGSAGLAVSHTAFYELYLNSGEGPEYFGLYTMVEEVDDTVIKTQFSSSGGNLYKPEGTGASFRSGSFSESYFEKKTNEDASDWSDIEKLFEVLHDNTRTSDPSVWRADLDTIFDTDVFLEYLAVNTTVQNWDTYGRMTHNYFLYNNPETDKLTWIPWDNNEALQEGKMGGSPNLNFSDVSSSSWPLIGYIYADPVYRAKYESYLQKTVDGAFEVNAAQMKYSAYSALIEESVYAEQSGYTFLNYSGQFQTSIATLNSHADSRASAVYNYLN